MTVEDDFRRIDGIESIAEMVAAVDGLEPERRKLVVEMAMVRSRSKFTWAYMANRFGLSATEWPRTGGLR